MTAHSHPGLEPPPGTRALLFDCDGTLVDTLDLHRIVWSDIFGRYGFVVTREWWDRVANYAMEPFVREVIPDADPGLIDALGQEGTQRFVDSLHLLEPIEHVVEIARSHHGRLPLAVVSGGFRDAVIGSLDAVGITGLFDLIVTADDVVESKPAPDLYLRAAAELGVPTAACVAYEDSEIGIESAQAAGVGRVIDVRRPAGD